MGAKKGFQSVVLDDLTDEEVNQLVLSNWHKINSALKNKQDVAALRRLFRLELVKGENARPNVLERIRAALWRALTVRSRSALSNAVACVLAHDAEGLDEELQQCGFEKSDIHSIKETFGVL